MRGIFTKHFGARTIFQDFPFELEEGKVTALFAPSGSGKTTLLRLLCSLEENENTEPNDFNGLSYSMVFQEERLIESYSALENIKLVSNKTDREIKEGLFALSLENTEQRVSEYSGGMRRRVAILRALYASYDILLLDEPFKGLDEELLERSAAFVKEMTKGKTVVLVSHDERDDKRMGAVKVITL